MYFKQFYLNCLAHASYLIGSEGEASVVDPQRDVDEYIKDAEAHHLKIKYVIETHLHADFVSGHRELAARTGAEIVISEKAGAAFQHRAVKDGDAIKVGNVSLQIIETPGHTPESICVLITEEVQSSKFKVQSSEPRFHTQESKPLKILTGDTLFIGDVGRPDLAGGKGYTPQMMAAMMYDTLHEKLLKLPDDVEVYPAHGAGSMCGKSLSKETSSTIGEQRKFNYALQPMSKDSFVRMMTTDLADAPPYFPKDAEINRGGAAALSELKPPTALSAEEVKAWAQTHDERFPERGTGSSEAQTKDLRNNERHVILDVRSAAEFGAGHLPGSLNIGLGGQFAMWAGSLISLTAPLVIVANSTEQVAEAQTRLARVGIENLKGYLEGGIESWSKAGFELASVPQVSVSELSELLDDQQDLQVIDVRRPPEFASGHVPRAVHAPLATLASNFNNLSINPSKPTAVICAGGYRSSAATSILQQHGFSNLLNVTGGTSAWINAGYPVEIPPKS